MSGSITEKGALFIDGGYLRKIEINNIKIDYLKLSEKICSDLKINRLRTYFYYCMPIVRINNKYDLNKESKVQKFLTKLKRLPRFEVKLGKLQLIGNQFRQKMIDVLMSLDIATMSYEKQISHVILIAGDSDFVPAIRKAKSYGSIVHLYYHPSSVHNELLDEVDELHEIGEGLIKECTL
jgi:uncharacterized LabA/DUF88 family protein